MDETSDKAHADEVRGAEEALTPQPATDLTAQEAAVEAPAEAESQPTPEAPEPTAADPLDAVYRAVAQQWNLDFEKPFIRRLIAAKVEGDRELVELRRAAELREASRKPEPPKPPVTPPAQPRIPFHVLRGIAQDAARRMVSDDAAAALAPPLYNAFSKRTAALELSDGKEKEEALHAADRAITDAFTQAGVLIAGNIFSRLIPGMVQERVREIIRERDDSRRQATTMYRWAYRQVAQEPQYRALNWISPEDLQRILNHYHRATGVDLLRQRFQFSDGRQLSPSGNAELQYRTLVRWAKRHNLLPAEPVDPRELRCDGRHHGANGAGRSGGLPAVV